MKQQVIFGTLLSASMAVALSAQQPQGGQPAGASGSQNQSAAAEGQTVTLTGCIQPAGQMAGGTPGSSATGAGTGAAQRSQGYILKIGSGSTTGASGSSASGTTSGTAGTGTGATGTRTGSSTGGSGSSAASSQSSSYQLVGGDDQKLQQYVGQRVEVTGTLSGRQGVGGSAPKAGTGASGQSGATGGSTGGSSTGAGSATGAAPPATGGASSATGSTGGTMSSTAAQGQGMSPSLRVTSVRPAPGGGSCSQ
jgi:hypothetical protein